MKLIYDALRNAEDDDSNEEKGGPIWKVAQAIEDEIYRACSCPGREPKDAHREKHMRAYLARVRSLCCNLKDENNRNPGLKAAVLNGNLVPERLVRMTPDQLFPELRRKVVPPIISERDAHMATIRMEAEAERRRGSSMYPCEDPSCRGRTFTQQMQIRSADEGMTTYIECEECGKRYSVN